MDGDLEAALAMSLRPLSPDDPDPAAADAGAGATGEVLPSSILAEVLQVCWGDRNPMAKPMLFFEVMRRWRQGFQFRPEEPTALVQGQGGPCGVLAPVQAMLLKTLLFTGDRAGDWRNCTSMLEVLPTALAEILAKCSAADRVPMLPVLILPTGPAITIEEFHASLRATRYASIDEVRREIARNIALFESPFGVLQLLYSCVATRGGEQINDDLGLDIEPLVVLPFGHANQSLINLMLTGIATPHVHDGIKDVGMPLKGVLGQPEIGYLTVMESLRYIQVGQYLKNPQCPIWLVGSETHITVLFSLDGRLVEGEGPVTTATRVFNEFDGSGGGFVMADVLPQILAQLGVNKPNHEVAQMAQNMGGDIILLSSFLATLYPGLGETDTPAEFVVYHYNGIAAPGGTVGYNRGVAKSAAPKDFGTRPIMQVLRTKWTPLQVEWERAVTI